MSTPEIQAFGTQEGRGAAEVGVVWQLNREVSHTMAYPPEKVGALRDNDVEAAL